jgi:hypothetical protein
MCASLQNNAEDTALSGSATAADGVMAVSATAGAAGAAGAATAAADVVDYVENQCVVSNGYHQQHQQAEDNLQQYLNVATFYVGVPLQRSSRACGEHNKNRMIRCGEDARKSSSSSSSMMLVGVQQEERREKGEQSLQQQQQQQQRHGGHEEEEGCNRLQQEGVQDDSETEPAAGVWGCYGVVLKEEDAMAFFQQVGAVAGVNK